MNKKQKQMVQANLLGLRDELVRRRREIDRSWKELHGKEVEFEERAANENLAAGLGLLDGQEEETIEAIDRALARLEANVYDVCESCGGTISEKRHKSVPWTIRCIKCASDAEWQEIRRSAAPPAGGEVELPEDLQGLSDDQLAAAVVDAVRRGGRIPAEELTVTCRNGVVRLEGALPDERFHTHLEQIVYDTLGLPEVEDRIRIDRTAWARQDRSRGTRKGRYVETDSVAGGGTETIDAIKEGKSISPSEEIIPEKRPRKK
jgi:RNA polymerase-binding transcription factor DksA